jgi:predicted alpha/beta-hydrolase family hydrolase
VLEAAVREAAAELARAAKVPLERVVYGGRSMGGRVGSMVAADDGALGLVLLGYPLHPPGKATQLRVEHFPRLRMPALFVSGTRDAFGAPDELRRATSRIRGPVSFHWIETGDHGFKPLKSSGLTVNGVLADVASAVVAFVTGLPGPR